MYLKYKGMQNAPFRYYIVFDALTCQWYFSVVVGGGDTNLYFFCILLYTCTLG